MFYEDKAVWSCRKCGTIKPAGDLKKIVADSGLGLKADPEIDQLCSHCYSGYGVFEDGTGFSHWMNNHVVPCGAEDVWKRRNESKLVQSHIRRSL